MPEAGEEFEDIKGVIRIRISKRNRQHNGQNCSILSFILSQNMPKFELYKHNDEFFNIINGKE
jgi:hypothetical protein